MLGHRLALTVRANSKRGVEIQIRALGRSVSAMKSTSPDYDFAAFQGGACMYEHIALAAMAAAKRCRGTPSSYGIQQRRIAFAAGQA